MARDDSIANKTPRRGTPAPASGDGRKKGSRATPLRPPARLESSEELVQPPPASTPVVSLKLGELGRYQLLFELARGGMGTVFVGRLLGAHGFDRLVAIKRLHPHGADEEDIAAFLDEARLSAQIKHPNVVQTIELGEHDSAPFLVMELLEGVSLAKLRERLEDIGEKLDPLMATWIMSKVAAGLHAAHELCDRDEQPLSLVHRDVSPENVLLSFDGRVCVADFGVAKLAGREHQTQSGIVKGKFAYMSPEQTRAKVLDRRSDVFSFGVVLHECLTGRRLFASKSAADTIRRVCEKRPADPRKRRSEVPEQLAKITLRCLNKRRDRRYDDAGQLAAALRAVLREHGSPIDDSELGELLSHHFAEERQRLRSKIRHAIRVADGTSESNSVALDQAQSRTADSGPATAQGSVTASVSTGPPLSPRPLAGVWIGLTVLALLAGGIWWTVSSPTGGSAATNPSAGPGRDAQPQSVSPSASPLSSSALPTSASTSTPPKSAGAAATKTNDPRLSTTQRTPRPTTSTSGPPSASPTAASPPSATATSHKGVPFKNLDL